MLKLTEELAQKCLDNQLEINHVNVGITEWGTIDLKQVIAEHTAATLDDINYDVDDSTSPNNVLYNVFDRKRNKTVLGDSSADDVIAFIQNYQPKTTEE